MRKILIIKSGHSETWIDDFNDIVSFGDVFRSTTLLRNFIKDDIYWLGSWVSQDLLQLPQKLTFIELNSINPSSFDFASFDLVINLEKHELFGSFPFEKLLNFCGFYFDVGSMKWMLMNVERRIFTLHEWNDYCTKKRVITWGEKLHFLMGAKTENTLGCVRAKNTSPLYDFGLNWQVGKKWPSKQIGHDKWKMIHDLLSEKYSVSWQEGFDSLKDYQAWISKNRVLISLDSLGMHLSLALNKPTFAIFTATNSEEVDSNSCSYFYTPGTSDIDFNFIAESAIKLLNGK